MAEKIIDGNWQWKCVSETEDGLNEVLELAEPLVDDTGADYTLRIGDGITPGGKLLKSGVVIGGLSAIRILTPANGSTGIVSDPIITASVFSGIDDTGDTDVHVASRWMFALDENFTMLAYDSGRVTHSLTSIDLNVEGVSLPVGKVYARVSYESLSGRQVTSVPINFTVS